MIPDSREVNRQVLSEIRYFLDYYKVSPKVYISYERSAFYGIEDDSFRVTFDDNILQEEMNLTLEKGLSVNRFLIMINCSWRSKHQAECRCGFCRFCRNMGFILYRFQNTEQNTETILQIIKET